MAATHTNTVSARPAAIAAAGILGLLAVGALLVLRAPGLGWDEAVYASKARSLVTDVPASAWNLFRPPGLSMLGVLAAPVGFFDESVRVLSMALAVLGLAAYGLLGRLVAGPFVTLAAVLSAITMPIVLTELPLFHNDLPSAGALLALMAVLWHQLEVRPAPDRRLLLAPVLAAAAFYLRFGSLAAIAAIGATAIVLWGPSLWRHRRLTVAMLAVGVALAVPHLLLAATELGSPLGIILLSVDKANTASPLDAALVYLRALPFAIAGPVALPVVLAGLALGPLVIAQWVTRRRARGAVRRAVWLLVPAAVTTIALVVVSHAEPRYLVFPILAINLAGVVAAAMAIRWLIGRLRRTSDARVGVVLLAFQLVLSAAVVGLRLANPPSGAPDQAAWAGQAGAWIREQDPGPCMVVSTIYPILGWYAACGSDEFNDAPKQLLPDGAPPGATYLVFTSADGRRRGAATITRYRAIASDPLASLGNAKGGAEVTLARP